MAKEIKVTTGELRTTASQLRSWAKDYETLYNDILSKISDMSVTGMWTEIDSQTYREKTESFRPEFIKMKTELERYADFLEKTAQSYEQAQNEARSEAGALTGGR